MQIVRTIVWVVLAIALLIFSYNNWTPVEVKIWEDLILETKKPVLVILSFLVGFLPVWLLHRGTRWQMKRRITSLETAVRSAAVPAAASAASADQAPADAPSAGPAHADHTPADPAIGPVIDPPLQEETKEEK